MQYSIRRSKEMGKEQTQSEHPTFESVWAMFQESKKEDERRKREFDLEMKKRKEEEEQRRKEDDLKMKKEEEKYDRRIKKIEQMIKENGRQMGYLNNRFGEMVEHLVAPSIKQKFRALGFTFDHVSKEHEITDNGRKLAEIDLLLENGDIALAVEVKAKPVEKDVDEHIRRMEILRKKADANNDKRKYQGAIAGAIMSDELRNYTHKAGFYVIEQTGDTVKINIPKGFKPRVW